jgi:hypothetical protein
MAEATLLSERTIRRILKNQEEHKAEDNSFAMPGRIHNAPERNIETFVIVSTSYKFFAEEGVVELLK